jgi:hypothetical protein
MLWIRIAKLQFPKRSSRLAIPRASNNPLGLAFIYLIDKKQGGSDENRSFNFGPVRWPDATAKFQGECKRYIIAKVLDVFCLKKSWSGKIFFRGVGVFGAIVCNRGGMHGKIR